MDFMLWIWIGIAILAAIIEGATLNLVTIWVFIGSIFALIAAALGLPIFGQIIVLLVVSSILLVFTRPLLVKKLNVGKEKTNADNLIGEICYVTEDIDNIKGTGSAKINGLTWTARAEDDALKIKSGTKVSIKAIEGVKLIVNKSE